MGSSLSYNPVDISPDRIYVITGGNTGIGYETAKHVAIMGGHVILACRNTTKADDAVKRMQEEYETELKNKQTQGSSTDQPKKLNVEVMKLDLASFASVMKFIEEFKARNCPLNGFICNAGIYMKEKVITEDGFETSLQANFLSHLLIILHFLPLLIKSGDDSRIVQVSSMGHKFAKYDRQNFNAEKSFGGVRIYSNSKLYQLLGMFWLVRHMKDQSVTVASLHPGFVDTQMVRSSSMGNKLALSLSRTPFDGAKTSIKAITDPSLKGRTGVYLSDCKIVTPSSTSRDQRKQEEFMKFSLEAIQKYLPSNMADYINVSN